MNRSAHTTRFGFTLIEMLVVVSIIVIVMAISFPMIGAMRRDSSASAGINTISVAIPSVRRYATDDKTFSSDLDPTTATIVELGIYSGAAAIFTPAGEIRLTRNIDTAKSRDFVTGSRFLEQHGPRAIKEQGPGLPKRELNGFEDIDIDYLLLPSDTGVAGINRVSGGVQNGSTAADDGPPLLLPPPFAVWYNQSGYLVATGWDAFDGHHNDYQYVYYDGDYDGNFKALDTTPRSFRWTTDTRPYNPDTFNPNGGTGADPQAPDFDPNNWNDKEEKYELPFEAIEAVVGVYVYSRDDFEQANVMWRDGETNPKYAAPAWTDTSLPDNVARWLWMREHGEMIMFSKQTGALMRNRDE